MMQRDNNNTDMNNTGMRARLHQLLGQFPSTHFTIAEEKTVSLLPETRTIRLTLRTDKNEALQGWLTGPDRPWQQIPAMLYCHAHGNAYGIGADELVKGRPALMAPPYGQALAQAGIVALCIDLPCFGSRASQSESALAKDYLWHGQTLFGAMLADLQGAIGCLETIAGIDKNRIGAMGLSMGATLAFWLGALDQRIKAVAHLCCLADLATLVKSGTHDLHGHYMTVPGLLNQYRTGEIAGRVAPRPQLACMGGADPLTPPDAMDTALTDLRAAYARAHAAHLCQTLISQNTGHMEVPDMRAAVLDFFRRHL
ncbi:MAG: alpha/beta hydrolase family protein [Beijerinckiaceae bacterium]